MKKILATTTIACALILSSVCAHAANPLSFHNDETIPVNETQPNSCTGELIAYTGSMHISTAGTINDNKISFRLHINYQNLKAVGETSGIVYSGNAVLNEKFNENFNGAYETTSILSQVITAPGKGNNLVVKSHVHTTINANGEVTSEITSSSIECK